MQQDIVVAMQEISVTEQWELGQISKLVEYFTDHSGLFAVTCAVRKQVFAATILMACVKPFCERFVLDIECMNNLY
jgi:hypothetical protein